ncbi:MAG: phosphatidate cytidylyltransferase [Nitrospirota bacterium]
MQSQLVQMHLKRLIVAAVLLPLIYLYIIYLPSGYFLLLLILLSILALSEFYSMYYVKGALRYSGLFFSIIILYISYLSENFFPDIIIITVMAIISIRLLSKRSPRFCLSDISPSLIGVLYIAGLLAFQIQIRKAGPEWIVFLYATVWLSDTVAYYLGTSIGKKKLYKEVSPNKTVEGAIGSVIGGILAALILMSVLIPALNIITAILIGTIIGLVSVVGDLVESMFKRDTGVKDSSRMIPGHGGILDKIDGVLFAGPILYWILIALRMAR